MYRFTYKQDEFVKVAKGEKKVLAIDIQPEKACIFNCIVCNRGKTKYQCEWHDFGPVDEALEELHEKISKEQPDLIEIYGQGDILTNVHLGEIVDDIHRLGLPVRLITNCYLLGIGEHMKVATSCEEVVGAFGIVEEEQFQKYHRPLPELEFTAEKQNESIIRFSQQYKGKFQLRVFLSDRFNVSDKSLKILKEAISQVKYDSLWVVSTNKLAVDAKKVEEIRDYLES